MRLRSMVMVAAALALLTALLVPATAQLAVGGLVTLQSQDREHQLELQARLTVNAKFGADVIGDAHFNAVPSITGHVSTDFLFVMDNYEFRDIRDDFGTAYFIPVTGVQASIPIEPHYTDQDSRSKRQPAGFRFSVPAGALQSAMSYSIKLRFNLAKSSRTFMVFYKRSTQRGSMSFSISVRKMPEPMDAVQAFYQLLGFSPLIDVEQRQADTGGNDQQGGGQQANSPNGEVAELREQVARLTGAVSDLVAKVTAGASAPSSPPPAVNPAPVKPVAETPTAEPAKSYTINVLFRNANGTATLKRDGEARVCLNGRPHIVTVSSGKGQISVDLDPSREYEISYEMRVKTRSGWSGWSSPSSGTAIPAKFDSFEATCNWVARRV